MRDAKAEEQMNQQAAGDSAQAVAPGAYVPPRLTKVGNVRELLAGDGGTVTDIDPTAFDPHQSSPQ